MSEILNLANHTHISAATLKRIRFTALEIKNMSRSLLYRTDLGVQNVGVIQYNIVTKYVIGL